MFQRLGAIALASAMMVGTISAVSAQEPQGASQGGSLTITYDQVAYLGVTAANYNVNLGEIDAFGINPAGYDDADVCRDATQPENNGTQATYVAEQATTGTVISSTPYTLNITNISDRSDTFLVYLNGACNATPNNFSQAPAGGFSVPVPGGATTVTGDSWSVLFGALVKVGGPGSGSSTVTGTITAAAI
ncbi:MAG TPA: hypothetical protein VGT61_16325 [Thermomicrobiales bacterium]|jgi:hypothetical protein|nr:hypothetical protein [Thermomicrobiales bacterium]